MSVKEQPRQDLILEQRSLSLSAYVMLFFIMLIDNVSGRKKTNTLSESTLTVDRGIKTGCLFCFCCSWQHTIQQHLKSNLAEESDKQCGWLS